ncbi:DUF3626 domain-containing protein [Halomonas sp. MCCC 1A11036]|uniref:DUF3626 domain-containing protein n=1 Tax=Billgrantia zhangzhouensis TaxID=2733481 RepID=A0ABS9ADY3_9GAMM|nr:DUF3626 domain-containing protein [Halomonas zhangzhouensis]MCE8019931.1 DUF3626 domain-containing protein [Halomonas zhangzhouensis]
MDDEMKTKNNLGALSNPQSKCIDFFRKIGCGKVVTDTLEVTINFHPDRLTATGMPVLAAINSDGVLKSQFETRTSNGGLTAFPGGARWVWESCAFKGVYDSCAPSARPKYGALNYKKLASGGSPRFGSSYFKLKSTLLDRVTFCYPESFFGPRGYGAGPYVGHLIEMADTDERDSLDHYIEAHIHGVINIYEDIQALVLDPSYKNTEVERLASELPFEITWHLGFKLLAEKMNQHPGFRGHEIVRAGQEIAVDGWLTPEIIGKAVNEEVMDAQKLKKIWHYLARFGDQNL